MRIELSKHIPYRDGELEAVSLDLEELTGYDILAVENELRTQGVTVPAWEYSREFLLGVASRAAHVPADVLKNLSIGDFTKIINEVLIFLAGSASSSATGQNSGA